MPCTHLTLTPTALSVRRGRHLVMDTLPGCGFDELIDVAALLVSEALTNAVVHANTEVELTICCSHRLLICVRDHDATTVLTPVAAAGLQSLLTTPDLDAESGRGLALIATLSDEWGIWRSGDGKLLWFTLVADTEHQHLSAG